MKARKSQNMTAVFLAVLALIVATVSLLKPCKVADYNEITTKVTEVNFTMPVDNYTHFQAPENNQPTSGMESIQNFVEWYPNSQLKGEYLQIITAKCNNDPQLIKKVVAIATAETGQGKASPLSNNFWGWFKNGNREYNPDRDTMAADICTGISTYYSNISTEIADIYTGGDSTSDWYAIYTWAMSQMPK